MSPIEPPQQRKREYHDTLCALFQKHARVKDVVAASGLSKATVVRWRAVPENWAEVEALRGELLQDTLARWRQMLPGLADELGKIALDANEGGAVRVRAIATVFEQFKGLADREELEKKIADLKTQFDEAVRFTRGVTPIARARPATFITAAPIHSGASK